MKGLRVDQLCDNLFQTAIDIYMYMQDPLFFKNIYVASHLILSKICLMGKNIKYMSVPGIPHAFFILGTLTCLHISHWVSRCVRVSQNIWSQQLSGQGIGRDIEFARNPLHMIAPFMSRLKKPSLLKNKCTSFPCSHDFLYFFVIVFT